MIAKRFLRPVLALIAAVTVVPLLEMPAAHAVPPASPTLIAPANGASVNANPVLTWTPPANPNPMFYGVQISSTFNFSAIFINVNTYNTSYTPTTDLPLGQLFWRVTTFDTVTGESSVGGASLSFTRTPPDGPGRTAPLDGGVLTFPTQTPALSWLATAGSATYEVVVDDDPAFTPPFKYNIATVANSYILPAPDTLDQVLYWKVRGLSVQGLATQWSTTGTFTFDWPLVPVPTYPPNELSVVPPAPFPPPIEEVVLKWAPVAGASYYELQVDDDQLFNSLTISTTSKSTVFAPAVTLPNDTYFWRVRARNAANAFGDWSQLQQFSRAWPGTRELPFLGGPGIPPTAANYGIVTLLTPTDGNFGVTVPTFAWTPQRLASAYEVQVSPDQTFNTLVTSCTTTHTTVTGFSGCGLLPAPGVVYYWRVRGIDYPAGVLGIFSAKFSFLYSPPLPAYVSPGPAAATSIPLLTWGNVSSIGRYRLTVTSTVSTAAVVTVDTNQTEHMVQNLAAGSYRWYVQTVDVYGRIGVTPGTGSWRTFTYAPPAPGPSLSLLTPNGQPGTHVPTLRWTLLADADYYRVWHRPQGSPVWIPLPGAEVVRAPGYTYAESSVSSGTYEYYVEAFKADATLLTTSAVRTFVLQSLAPANGLLPPNCDLNAAPSGCQIEVDTPTFTWTPIAGATFYRLWQSRDGLWTNPILQYESMFTILTPTTSYADSQAGQATFWYVQPCFGQSCAPSPDSFAGAFPPIQSFRKQSRPVELVSPAIDSSFENQVTFRWTDYLFTNRAPVGGSGPVTNEEAYLYRVEVSTFENMSNAFEVSTVDQTQYTAYAMTYPEGPIYWRVSAYDGSSNLLAASPTRKVNKASPKVILNTPAPGEGIGGIPFFTWAAQNYATAYEVEVYRTNISPVVQQANLVLYANPNTNGFIPQSFLAPGEYGWRVRRRDSNNLPGPWSGDSDATMRRFTYTGLAATLTSPEHGASIGSNTNRLTWTPVTGAAQYRVEISTSSTHSTPLEYVNTVMTEYAPTLNYPEGVYYWRIVTLDNGGQTLATSATRSFLRGPVQPTPVYFYPLTPSRILDSRPAPEQVGPFNTPWSPAQQTRNRTVTNLGGVPANAGAVSLNVTVTNASASSFLTLWPAGQTKPTASSVNFAANQVVANAVTVKVGAAGAISIFNNSGTVNVLIDVVGYYAPDPGDGLTPLAPKRILDSRTPPETVGPFSTPWTAGTTRSVTVTGGTTGVPTNASAVILNVTATTTSASSFLTLYPAGVPKPTASSINWPANLTIANSVTVKVGTAGAINVFNNSGSVNVLIDVVGYFASGTGAPFRPLSPFRVLDSRPPSEQVGPYATPWIAGQSRDVPISGGNQVPASATAVLLNVTATSTSANSFLTVWPTGEAKPTASSVNWGAGSTIANSVTAKLGSIPPSQGKQLSMFNNSGNVNVIVDVNGYYG